MTIEKTIQDLTAAVVGLTEVLKGASITSIAELKNVNAEDVVAIKNAVDKTIKKEPKTTDAEIVPETPKAKKPAKAVEAPNPTQEEDLSGEAEITVEVLRERTTAFGETKGREATIALLTKYGAKKGSEVALDLRRAYVAEINKTLGV